MIRGYIGNIKFLATNLLILLPFAAGECSNLIVRLNHWLFSTDKISVRGAIGIELLYLAAFLVVCTIAVAVAIQIFKVRKHWWGFPFAAMSIAIASGLPGKGFQTGSALLYAT